MNRGKFWLTLVAIIIVVSAIYYFGITPSPTPTPSTPPTTASSTPAAAPAATDTVATAAQDAQRLGDAHSLGEALAAYFKDHAAYPPPTAGTTCAGMAAFDNVGGLAGSLVPQYLKAIPKDPNPRACVYNYQYWSDVKNYAILVNIQSIDPYKYNDHWCIGAAAGTMPDLRAYLACP
jgi:hypothetical protein